MSCRILIVAVAAVATACSTPRTEPEVRLVLAGQALIKKDPRIRWDDPYGTLRPILDRADVAFTNFEMAVVRDGDRCGVPADYEVSLGSPPLPAGDRPGNAGGPHALAPEVMAFLADLGFNLMSLSNNHAWDLGDCGVAATRAAAEANGASYRQDDWDRSLAAVREAAANADIVLYYQHFQLDRDEFSEASPGDTTSDGHVWVDDVAKWQSDFARAVLDAGASMYVGHARNRWLR